MKKSTPSTSVPAQPGGEMPKRKMLRPYTGKEHEENDQCGMFGCTPAEPTATVDAPSREDELENALDTIVVELEGLDLALVRLGDGEFVEGYQMKTGIWHRILGLIRGGVYPIMTKRSRHLQGWVSVAEKLPDDDSAVYAAVLWTHTPSNTKHYVIHHCDYYEGGKVSGQKIFADCEGEEFEAVDVAYWIYEKDLAQQLPAPPATSREEE